MTGSNPTTVSTANLNTQLCKSLRHAQWPALQVSIPPVQRRHTHTMPKAEGLWTCTWQLCCILPSSNTGGGAIRMIESMLASRRCSTMLCRFCLNSGTGTCCRALQHSCLENPGMTSHHNRVQLSMHDTQRPARHHQVHVLCHSLRTVTNAMGFV